MLIRILFFFGIGLIPVLPLSAQKSVLTYKYDRHRSGWNSQETVLKPANVNPATFGKLFQIATDGKPDAQPLYVPNLAIPGKGTHNVLFVETEVDSVYCLDADTGAQLWKTSALIPGETQSDNRGVGSVTPYIGITATPVINLQMGPHGTIYLAAMSKDASSNYHHRIHALDITTGAEEFGGPVEVQATYPGSGPNAVGGVLTFNPAMYKEQAALSQVNGLLVTGWSSHDDTRPYNGWLIAYDERTLQRKAVICLTPNGTLGSIWQARSGPAVDVNGFLYVMVANGTFDTTLDGNGFPSSQDYGNAIVKLQVTPSGFQILDYFAMANVSQEVDQDIDLGSAGPILLPTMKDSGGTARNLIAAAGKDHTIYLADINNLGKFDADSDQIYQEVSDALVGKMYASPVYFNSTIFYSPVEDVVRAFRLKSARIQTPPVATSVATIGQQGMNLIVSSNGADDGILWGIECSKGFNVLHAYDAKNFSGKTLVELYNSNMAAKQRDRFGGSDHFVTPMVVNGKAYAASSVGIGVFGLLPDGAR